MPDDPTIARIRKSCSVHNLQIAHAAHGQNVTPHFATKFMSAMLMKSVAAAS